MLGVHYANYTPQAHGCSYDQSTATICQECKEHASTPGLYE
jgi:hypothetical protein